MADQYLATLDAMDPADGETYLSIKLPALQYSNNLLAEVAERARQAHRRIHFDSLAPDSVDRTQSLIDDLLDAVPGVALGYTLVGRWRRSLDDARWACERGLWLRVVKGEFPDAADSGTDLQKGFLDVIDCLGGFARHVSVASHDRHLFTPAIRRLQAAGTPCDMELLYRLPMRAAILHARQQGIEVCVYIPYGHAYLPYRLSQALRHPRILWWLLKDLAYPFR